MLNTPAVNLTANGSATLRIDERRSCFSPESSFQSSHTWNYLKLSCRRPRPKNGKENFICTTQIKEKRNVIYPHERKVQTFVGNRWLKFLCALWMFFSFPPSISFIAPLSSRDLRLGPNCCVWREDYFLTKLKTYLHTMCHVPLWCFKIGMFNKLLIMVLVVPFLHHPWFYDSWYYFFHRFSSSSPSRMFFIYKSLLTIVGCLKYSSIHRACNFLFTYNFIVWLRHRTDPASRHMH